MRQPSLWSIGAIVAAMSNTFHSMKEAGHA
jgi:hypothetical protein